MSTLSHDSAFVAPEHFRQQNKSGEEQPSLQFKDFAPSQRQSMIAHAAPPSSESTLRVLAALSIGAPLITSVVISIFAVVQAEIVAMYPDTPPHDRPANVQATFALIWSAVVTSLGSTMSAVAGLAMAAGYHDNHVGVTKLIVRRVREWTRQRRSKQAATPDDPRPTTPACPSVITDNHEVQHSHAAHKATEVSSRLLGMSVVLLVAGLLVYLITTYPPGGYVPVLVIGSLTAAYCAVPLLPVIFPASRTSPV